MSPFFILLGMYLTYVSILQCGTHNIVSFLIIETVEGEFMSDLMSKSLVDVNINSDFKKRKSPKKKGKKKLKLD